MVAGASVPAIPAFPDDRAAAAWCINKAYEIGGGDLPSVLLAARQLLSFINAEPAFMERLVEPLAVVTPLHPAPKVVS